MFTSIDFVGNGVTATNVGNAVTVTIPSGDTSSFITGVNTGPTITGDGVNNVLNIPVSTDSNNLLVIGTDGRLFADSGSIPDVSSFITSVTTDATITGDGSNNTLGVAISSDANNQVSTGTDGAIYVSPESGNLLEVLDEGSSLSTNVESVDFVGDGVTVTNVGDAITVTIPGGSGGGGSGVTDTFTNTEATPVTLGGIPSGSTFSDKSLTGLWDDLLYPYQSPTFTDFDINITSPLEVGYAVNTGTYSFSWGTTNSGNISGNVVNIYDVSNSITIVTGTTNDGTGNFELADSVRNTTGSNIWRISGVDTSGNGFYKDFSVDWQQRIFYGENTGVGITETDIEALRVNQLASDPDMTYQFVGTGYKYIAYPTGMGITQHFLDVDSDINVSMQDSYTETLVNASGVTGEYYVYRTTHTLASGINIAIGASGNGDNYVHTPHLDPADTHTFGIQQYDWIAMTNEAVIDITGSSPSQTTTLTTDRELSFTGTLPSGKDRVYYAEITPDGKYVNISKWK